MPGGDRVSAPSMSLVSQNGVSKPSAAAVARNQSKPSTRNLVTGQWKNSASTELLKQALSQSGAISSASSCRLPAANGNKNQSPGPSQFSQMNIGRPLTPTNPPGPPPAGQKHYNPSMGPSGSTVSNYPNTRSGASSRMSTASRYQARVNNAVCKTSGYRRQHFRNGDVISLPFHKANTNPDLEPTDDHLRITCEGPVYTKRRMLVVLWIYQRDMFCVPLYTFNHTGLQNKQGILEEYVSVSNWDDRDFENQGMYMPVVADCKRRLDQDTTIHITGGIKVACNEDIYRCGRISQESHIHLVDLWETLRNRAKNVRW